MKNRCRRYIIQHSINQNIISKKILHQGAIPRISTISTGENSVIFLNLIMSLVNKLKAIFFAELHLKGQCSEILILLFDIY